MIIVDEIIEKSVPEKIRIRVYIEIKLPSFDVVMETFAAQRGFEFFLSFIKK